MADDIREEYPNSIKRIEKSTDIAGELVAFMYRNLVWTTRHNDTKAGTDATRELIERTLQEVDRRLNQIP